MLRIRPEQLEHFANRTRDRFVGLMTDYIREAFPERAARIGPGLTAWVRRALAVCERYKVTMEPEAAQLMLLLLVLGVDADEREAWISEALARDVAPIGKVRRLVAACRERGLSAPGGIEEMIVFDDYRDEIEES